ncbi:MAG TPA: hypothetical protein VMM92_12010, partial [Thermoanaerobaculia bacterium]|nr:hypothetical protein [Thermoanaerobaculia bacterium]
MPPLSDRPSRRNRLLPSLGLFVLLFCGASGLLASPPALAAIPAPPAADPALAKTDPAAALRVARLSHLIRLWGALRYLHPYLAYRDLNWDAALLNAIPAVRAARTREEYRSAVQGMLALLNDPATRVEEALPPSPPPAPTAGRERPPISRWLSDSVLWVDWSSYSGYAVFRELPAALKPLWQEIPKAHAVIFDLRGKPTEGSQVVDYSSALEEVAELLVGRPLQAPTRRYLMHSGYRPQVGFTSGGYFSAFLTLFAPGYSPRLQASPGSPGSPGSPASQDSSARGPSRVVFLAGKATVLSDLVLALQAGGEGRIVSVGGISADRFVDQQVVDLGENLAARVRVSETLPLPGWPGVHADVELPEAASEERVLAAALSEA